MFYSVLLLLPFPTLSLSFVYVKCSHHSPLLFLFLQFFSFLQLLQTSSLASDRFLIIHLQLSSQQLKHTAPWCSFSYHSIISAFFLILCLLNHSTLPFLISPFSLVSLLSDSSHLWAASSPFIASHSTHSYSAFSHSFLFLNNSTSSFHLTSFSFPHHLIRVISKCFPALPVLFALRFSPDYSPLQ